MPDLEYHTPSEPLAEDRELAPLGDEYNATASDPPRRTRRKARWVSQLVGTAAAVALLTSAVAASGGGARLDPAVTPPPAVETPVPVETGTPSPEPSEEPALTLTEAIGQYPDWYDESRGVWLHFEGAEGWFADSSFFHRFTWAADGDTKGTVTMSYQDIGGGYTLEGSVSEPAQWPMTLSFEKDEYHLVAYSGMGEGNIGSSYEYSTPELTDNSFVPVSETGANTAGMEGVLGRTTAQWLESAAHLTVVERADVSFGGLDGAVTAAMTDLWFDPGGHGSLFFDDGTVAEIEWSVSGDHSPMVRILYDNVTFSDGMTYMSMNTGELTLTSEGPRLWLYNSMDNKETCFTPAN